MADGRPVKLDLRPCRHCGRKFVPESLAKHEPNCLKVQKKRKPFDPAKQRVTEDLSLKQIKSAQKKQIAPPKSHWKSKHEEFIRNIRAAKGAQVAMERGEPLPPPPPPSLNPDYVTCPYCDRRFNEKAAERHISFCKEQTKRVNAKREPSVQEKTRAAAQKYQPPKPKVRNAPEDSPSMGNDMIRGIGAGGASSRGGSVGGAKPVKSLSVARGTTVKPTGSKSEIGSNASSDGNSSRGRGSGPTSISRGRPSPASQGTYQARHDSPISDPGSVDLFRIGSGIALRTGRDKHHYEEAKREAQGKYCLSMSKTSQLRGGLEGNHLVAPQKSGHIMRGTDSGYYSSNSEGDVKTCIQKSRPISAAAKFCHECGTKFPNMKAKFCVECGIQRVEVPIS